MEHAKVKDGLCDCAWHHGARQGARLYDLVTGEVTFLLDSLGRDPGRPCPRTHHIIRRWPLHPL